MTVETTSWLIRKPTADDRLVGPTLLTRDVRLSRFGHAEGLRTDPAESLAEHLTRFGRRPRGTAGLVESLDRADLTGRGGAHVPAALKWRAALRADGPVTVAANGAESEPISAKDGTLLRQRPHLVLDGLALAAEALGARRAVLWLHGDDTGSRLSAEAALEQRRRAGFADPLMEIVNGPAHYLAGEASAITQALSGGPMLPTQRRRGPSVPGAPHTLVQNVETLARAALVARNLPATRSTLLTVLTAQDRMVIEVARGIPLVDVLSRAGALRGGTPQAVLLGGFGGAWATWAEIADVQVDEPAMRRIDMGLGAGIIAPLDQGACGVAETAAMVRYLADMSAKQCGPCMFGLPALARSLKLLADGRARRDERARLIDDLDLVTGRGACNHPDGATRLISSALRVFGRDVAEHAAGRPCPSAGRPTLPVPAVTR